MSALSAAAPVTTLDAIQAELKSRLPAARYKEAQAFTAHLLRRVGSDDLAARAPAEWAALALDLLEFVRVRKLGKASVRVFNPSRDEQGYESAHTVLQILTEDSPFLVDSVGMAIHAAEQAVHAVIHPLYKIERDAGGHVLSILADTEEGKGKHESLMHFEISRISDAAELTKLHDAVASALDDVRDAVADWKPMREKMLAVA